MTILEVGKLNDSAFNKRNFYDLVFRQKTQSIIQEFAKTFKIPISSMEWKNFGQEDDINEIGVVLVINKCYELRYKLVSEDFQVWYRDLLNPKIITEIDEGDNIECACCELFHNIASDEAKRKSFIYFDTITARGDFPTYPDDPPYKRQPLNEEILSKAINSGKM